MSNTFVRKMESFVHLSSDDRRTLEAAVERPQRFGPRETIHHEGEQPDAVTVLLEGWACRYKLLPDGRRQILALLLPGDMCDPHIFLLPAMDHSLGTLTSATVAKVHVRVLGALTASSPALAEALNREILSASKIQREWIVSLGRRTAMERLAHLFCEISARLRAVGRQSGAGCELLLTQTDLADAMGLSTVHVNRTLQELKARGIMEMRSRRLVVHDRLALESLAMFHPGYLHQREASDMVSLSA